MKINTSTISLVERLCDFKMYAISVLSFIGSVCAPDKATIKGWEPCSSVCHCRTVQRYPSLQNYLRLAPSVDLVLIWLVPIPSAWPPATGLRHAHPHFAEALEKSVQHTGTIALLFLLSLPLEFQSFLSPTWPLTLRTHTDCLSFGPWWHTWWSAATKKGKAATGLLLNKLHKQDFAGPFSSCLEDILDHMKNSFHVLLVLDFWWASCASFCNGLYTAQRFHTEGTRAHVSCWMPKWAWLTHYNVCPRLYNIFYYCLDTCFVLPVLPQRNHFPHDLITLVFLRSFPHGIVVMGFLDAFVYTHNQHRRIIENAVNIGDCMTGRIRFMTAIIPAYAHAFLATGKHFVLPSPMSDIRIFPMFVP